MPIPAAAQAMIRVTNLQALAAKTVVKEAEVVVEEVADGSDFVIACVDGGTVSLGRIVEGRGGWEGEDIGHSRFSFQRSPSCSIRPLFFSGSIYL